jgi:hypothetical protein
MMATFNFHGDNTVHGQQYIAQQDMFVFNDPGRAEAAEALTALLRDIKQATSSGLLEQAPGDEACTEISAAVATLSQRDTDAPVRAQASLTRARDILTTAALVPGLAEGLAKAVEAIRSLC